MSMNINIVYLLVLLQVIVVHSNKTAKGRTESSTFNTKVKDVKNLPKRRAVGIGDLIAKVDFLPIAARLRKKVERPGEGGGIVSSSKSNQELADKLFENFFFTKSSIVQIQDNDIPGLNSFQALALCGSEYEPDSHFFSVYRYYIVGNQYIPRYCRYMLISRPMEIQECNSGNKSQEIKKRPFNIIKEHSWYSIIHRKNNTLGNQTIDKSGKQKQLFLDTNRTTIKKTDLSVDAKESKAPVIIQKTTSKFNTSNIFDPDPRYYQLIKTLPEKKFRRHLKDRKKEEAEKFQQLLQIHYRKQINTNKIYFERFRKIDKRVCYWKFKCDYPMAWCQLIPECTESENKVMDDIPIDHKRDEHNEDIKLVRDMLGIYLVDEEVEKILIQRRNFYILEKKSKRNRSRPLVGKQIDQPVIKQYIYSSKKDQENEALSVKDFFDSMMKKHVVRESNQFKYGPKKTTRPQFNYLGERVKQAMTCGTAKTVSDTKSVRPLEAGDILTAQDFLVIAQKLREKVGKGIVSSAKSDEILADRLYRIFYLIPGKFKTLRDVDFPAIDALQALALSGADFDPQVHYVQPKKYRRTHGLQSSRFTLVTRRISNLTESFDPKPIFTKKFAKHRFPKQELVSLKQQTLDATPKQKAFKDNFKSGRVRRAVHEAKKLSAHRKLVVLGDKSNTFQQKKLTPRIGRVRRAIFERNGITKSTGSSIKDHRNGGSADRNTISNSKPSITFGEEEIFLEKLRINSTKPQEKGFYKTEFKHHLDSAAVMSTAKSGSQRKDFITFPRRAKNKIRTQQMYYDPEDVVDRESIIEVFTQLTKKDELISKFNRRSMTKPELFSEMQEMIAEQFKTTGKQAVPVGRSAENIQKEDHNDEEYTEYHPGNPYYPQKIDKSKCYWMYRCMHEWNTKTCHLFPECYKEESNHFIIDDIPIHHSTDEHTHEMKTFRDYVGLYLVDEEVEKIFERRFSEIKVQRPNAKQVSKLDSLNMYFEDIIRAQLAGTTKSAKNFNDKKQQQNKFKYLKNLQSLVDDNAEDVKTTLNYQVLENLGRVRSTTPLVPVYKYT